jgi:Fe-S-cluster-containing dehydrogenase component
MRLITKASLCSGCLSCMTVCSTVNDGYSSLASSRIEIELDEFGGDNRIFVCRQCAEPGCAKACPVDAIYKDNALGVWRVDYGLCIGCRECVEACRFSAMFFDPLQRRVVKCELCAGRGSPACVEACPTGALRLKV